MVGHTHEAVDRQFSFINRCMKKMGNVMTSPDMKQALLGYMKDGTPIRCDDLHFVGDWKKWLEGHHHQLHDHTNKGSALHWQFQRDATPVSDGEGPVLLRYKHLCNDEQWAPQES